MLYLALCDDEPQALGQLQALVEAYMRRRDTPCRLFPYSRGEALLAGEKDFDLVLLDIKMAGCSGMEVARRLRARGCAARIVFITALREYVFEAFDVGAVHYLLKPVDAQKLRQVLDRCVDGILREKSQCLPLRQGAGIQNIPLRDILYCEARGHKTLLSTTRGAWEAGDKLEKLAASLGEPFFRCHRSYLVNFDHVRSYRDGLAWLTSGEKVPVAKRRQQEFMRAMLLYQRREVR